jgi:TPR repeat protein
LTWTVVLALIVALTLLGCSEKAEEKPQSITATSGEEDAYQTAVFAQQRAEWQQLAEQGDARSQRQLGIMYYLGQGIDVDHTTAAKWLGQAAEQGDDVAQLTFGVMHVEGHGVPQSHVTAHMWFSLSAQQGNSSARIRLDQLVPEMNPSEIAEAQDLAAEWKPST